MVGLVGGMAVSGWMIHLFDSDPADVAAASLPVQLNLPSLGAVLDVEQQAVMTLNAVRLSW